MMEYQGHRLILPYIDPVAVEEHNAASEGSRSSRLTRYEIILDRLSSNAMTSHYNVARILCIAF